MSKGDSSFKVTTEPFLLEPVSQACVLTRKVLLNVTVSCCWFGACRSTSRNWPAWPRWGRNSSPTSRVFPTSPSCLTWPEVWHRSPQLETSFQPTEATLAGQTDGRTERWTSFSCSSKPSFLFESQDSCSGASNHGGGGVRKKDLWNLYSRQRRRGTLSAWILPGLVHQQGFCSTSSKTVCFLGVFIISLFFLNT